MLIMLSFKVWQFNSNGLPDFKNVTGGFDDMYIEMRSNIPEM